MSTAQAFEPATPISVSRLNQLAREALESALPLLWITGEVSNLVRAASGHIYFTLKDDRAQVRCTLWRNRAQLVPFRLEQGQQVELRALATLYEARGDFQLSVESVRRAGMGSLFEAYMRLRQQLEAEGLFDPGLKRPLPRFPRGIGVVTSPQAAALQDVLAALRRRAPGLAVVLYPAQVQGEAAPAQLVAAIETASRRAADDGIDLILLVRGGGSLEDLWAFNDARLARAVRASSVPVVSGVGHESDFVISDFAADLRAATPTAAAELATTGYVDLALRLDALQLALGRAMERRIQGASQRLDRAQLRLVHPAQRLARMGEQLAALEHRLGLAGGHRLGTARRQLDSLAWRLRARRPRLETPVAVLAPLALRLQAAATRRLEQWRARLAMLEAALGHLDPGQVLVRGYGIVRDGQGRLLADATRVAPGDRIRVTLARGELAAQVTASHDQAEAG